MTGRSWFSSLLPERGLPRSLAWQSLLFSLGSGMFLTGSAVYFIEVVRLTPVQIGIGLSIAVGLSLILSVPLGSLADRVGVQKAWIVGALICGAAYCCYPLVKGFWPFVVAVLAIRLADVFAAAGRGAYTIGILPPENRVRTQSFMRSALNVGITVGAGMGAVVLAFQSHAVLNLMVFASAAGYATNAYSVSRLPKLAPNQMRCLAHRGRVGSRSFVIAR